MVFKAVDNNTGHFDIAPFLCRFFMRIKRFKFSRDRIYKNGQRFVIVADGANGEAGRYVIRVQRVGP